MGSLYPRKVLPAKVFSIKVQQDCRSKLFHSFYNCATSGYVETGKNDNDLRETTTTKKKKKKKKATGNFDSNSDLYKLYVSKIAGSTGFRAVNLNRLATLHKAHLSG